MKSPHKFLLSTLLIFQSGRASALSLFECVQGLLPITQPAEFKGKRTGVEKPFVAADKYIVFPEIKSHRVTGFYIYESSHAWYFDAIEEISNAKSAPKVRTLSDLPSFENQIYRLIAQVDGLETLTLEYMPGFLVEEPARQGSVVLGASVLPGVGAFLSRPKPHKEVYNDPSSASEDDLKAWIFSRLERRPADASAVEIPKVMMRLKDLSAKSNDALWEPLRAEFRVRKDWIQTHNLDEESFRTLSALMKTSCRD